MPDGEEVQAILAGLRRILDQHDVSPDRGFGGFHRGRVLGQIHFSINQGAYSLFAVEGPEEGQLTLQGVELSTTQAAVAWQADFSPSVLIVVARALADQNPIQLRLDLGIENRQHAVWADVVIEGNKRSCLTWVNIDGSRMPLYIDDIREGFTIFVVIIVVVVVVAAAVVITHHEDVQLAHDALQADKTVTISTNISATGSGSVSAVGSGSTSAGGSGSISAGTTITIAPK